MKIEKNDELPEGHVIIKMTPHILQEQYLPALEEIAQTPYPGKFALVVIKNYQYARRAHKAWVTVHGAMMERAAERDEHNKVITEKGANGQEMLKFSTPEKQAEFSAEFQKAYQEALFDVRVQRVARDEANSVSASIRPVTLIMLAPMFVEEAEEGVGSIPDEFKELVASHAPKDTSNGTPEPQRILRSETPEADIAEPVRSATTE